jgi:hypothetical protein
MVECRYCGKPLLIRANGVVLDPDTRERLPRNFYGGWVCSRNCDVKACVAMRSSFPGAGPATRPGDLEQRQIDDNWPEKGGE